MRNQILPIDPLSTMSKAYTMVLQIELHNEAYQITEMSTLTIDYKRAIQTKKFDKNKIQLGKKNIQYEFCKKRGHGRDT